MALLSRRSIQQLLDAATDFMNEDQVRRMVGRLNLRTKRTDAFATEWELIVLSGLSNVVEVAYEPVVADRQWPDVFFELSSGHAVVCEITAVSDVNLKQKNPVEALFRDFGRRTLKLQARGVTGGFRIKIGTKIPDDNRQRRRRRLQPQLAIPQEQKLNQYVFDSTFRDFEKVIIASPDTRHNLHVKNDQADLVFDYDPQRNTTGASMVAYDVPTHPECNPVYAALDKKADQISAVLGDLDTVGRGIIVCDGGCALFGHSGFSGTYSFSQVIDKFLAENTRIQFVVGIDVQKASFGDPVGGWTFRTRLFTQPHVIWAGELSTIFNDALSSLPRPRFNVPTAKHRLADLLELPGGKLANRRSYRWGHAMRVYSDSRDLSLEISSTAVIDLISGKLGRESFERIVGPEAIRYLNASMSRGLSVSSIELKHNRDDDDDTLIIKFGGQDSARSEYRIPKSSRTQ